MKRLLLFPCIAILAAFTGCSQSVVEPVSQQPIGNIDSYFWTSVRAPIKFVDSLGTFRYTLDFLTDSNGMLTVSDAPTQKIEFVINQDSIYANGYSLLHDSVIDPDDGSYFIGDLVLLRNNLLAGDSSWVAGTLESRNHIYYNITARMLAHFDTLQVVTGNIITKYPDALMVRYKFEGTPSTSDTIPYWIVYYVKNIGPVMFDKVTVTTQKTVINRHEIAP